MGLESRVKAAANWILKCLQGGRVHPRAACKVTTLCFLSTALKTETLCCFENRRLLAGGAAQRHWPPSVTVHAAGTLCIGPHNGGQ